MSSHMSGKICLVTGANSGIGKATVLGLAKKDAKVVMLCRDEAKGNATQREIIEASGNSDVDLMLCDLSSQTAIRDFVTKFESKYDRLDVLINNAALVPPNRTETVDGIEMQLAVNHLAPFLLTHLLMGLLKKSAPSRIITVSSSVHAQGKINFDDLESKNSYSVNGWMQYCNTKLANIHFTYELARRLEGTGMTANVLHPGTISTNLQRGTKLLQWLMKLTFQTPNSGAETSIFLATSPDVEGISGQYFKAKKVKRSAPASYDEDTAKRLWDMSAKMIGVLDVTPI